MIDINESTFDPRIKEIRDLLANASSPEELEQARIGMLILALKEDIEVAAQVAACRPLCRMHGQCRILREEYTAHPHYEGMVALLKARRVIR